MEPIPNVDVETHGGIIALIPNLPRLLNPKVAPKTFILNPGHKLSPTHRMMRRSNQGIQVNLCCKSICQTFSRSASAWARSSSEICVIDLVSGCSMAPKNKVG